MGVGSERPTAVVRKKPYGSWHARRLDNVTHSLIGYALGRALPARDERAGRAALFTSVIASNAPDLDLVMGRFAHNRKLVYLLEHRGYTHSLLCALPLGLLIAALACAILHVPRAERAGVLALGALAALLHIGFDALNNYGVHPFFPFDDRWYYGDALFIVEPWLLALLLPLLALRGGSGVGRALGWSLLCVLLGLVFALPFVPLAVAIGTSLVLTCMLSTQRSAGASARPALFATALLLLSFGAAALRAKAIVRARLAELVPSERVLELIATPMPGDPICFDGIALTLDAQKDYHARFYSLSLAPRLVSRARCGMARLSLPTAPLRDVALAPTPGLAFSREFVAPIAALRRLQHEHCDAAAALRFMRAPYWIDGERPVLGDLRYDNAPGLEFAELALDGDCRDAIPPWQPPLAPWL